MTAGTSPLRYCLMPHPLASQTGRAGVMLLDWPCSLRACVFQLPMLAFAGLSHGATRNGPRSVRSFSRRGCTEDWDSGGHRVGNPLLCHTSGSSSSFWGLGKVSYVDLIRKLNLAWGNFYRSAHVMVLSMTASQVVHLPC